MANAGDDAIQMLVDDAKSGQECGKKSQPSIFRVVSVLRDLSPSSFDPRLISIGPLHKKDENVQESVGLKKIYLDDLLNSSHSTPEETLKACVQKVNASLDRIRASYADLKAYSDVHLVQMMVMDGCFILEFCRKHCEDYNKYLPNKMRNLCIAIDLILVENQIPFFVLQDLFDCTIKKIFPVPLTSILHKVLATYFHPFSLDLPENSSGINVETDSTHDHVLGFFHKCYELTDATPSKPVDVEADSTRDHVLCFCHNYKLTKKVLEKKEAAAHSVVDLDRSGVNFKPHQETKWPMTIQFKSSSFACFPFSWCKPTLFMPTLIIDDYTEPVLRNFIAYEQSLPQVHYNFTSYAYAMDKLIDTQEDVSKLVESNVLVNRLGSNEEAANLLNRICKNISLVDYCYTKQLEKLDKYYNGFWPKNVAWLRRRYFNSPWNAIALFAGIILFALTVVQTVFTILAK